MITKKLVHSLLIIGLMCSTILYASDKSSFGFRASFVLTGLSAGEPETPDPYSIIHTKSNIKILRDDTKDKSRRSFSLQLVWDYRFNRYFEFESGLGFLLNGMYSEANLSFEYEEPNYPWPSTTRYYYFTAINDYKLSYIHLPLSFKLLLPYKVAPYLEFGTGFNFNLSSKLKQELKVGSNIPEVEDVNSMEDKNMKDQTHFLDFGFLIGLGLRVDNSVYIASRLYIGQRSIYKDMDIKNGAIMFMFGFNF